MFNTQYQVLLERPCIRPTYYTYFMMHDSYWWLEARASCTQRERKKEPTPPELINSYQHDETAQGGSAKTKNRPDPTGPDPTRA